MYVWSWECGSVCLGVWECGSVWLGVWVCVLKCGSVWLGVWERVARSVGVWVGSVRVCGWECDHERECVAAAV